MHGSVEGYAQFLDRNGNAIGGGGGSTLGFSFDPNRQLSPYRLVEGSAPTTADDVVMDKATATKYHFAVGDRVLMNLPDRAQTFTITGIVTFGSDDNLAGVTLAGFDLPTAQSLFNSRGHYDTISVLAAPGADNVRLQLAIARLLPPGVEVVSGQTVANELSSAVDNELSFISTALLIFAAISLFVGGFTIFNTFSITVGQRTRELALLRVVGASRAAGVPVGARRGRADGARRLGDRPRARRPGRARPQGAAQGVRHRAALGAARVRGSHGRGRDRGRRRRDRDLGDPARPARGADRAGRRARRGQRRRGRVGAPAARDRRDRRRGRRRGRGAGGAGRAGGRAGRPRRGAGVHRRRHARAGRGPAAVERARAPAGLAARHAGKAGAGELDAQPAPDRPDRRRADDRAGAGVDDRRPRRLALRTSAKDSVDSAVSADYIVTGSGGFSKSVAPAVSRLPGVTTATTIYQGQFEFRGSLSTLVAATPANLPRTVTLHVTAGSGAPAMAAGQLLIDTTTASADNLHVGSVVPVKFAQTGRLDDDDRRDLQAQPAGRQLRRRRRASSSRTSTIRSRSACC